MLRETAIHLQAVEEERAALMRRWQQMNNKSPVAAVQPETLPIPVGSKFNVSSTRWERAARWRSMRLGAAGAANDASLVDESEAKAIVDEAFSYFATESTVTIRGFYSSGTNWLRSLFKKNCPRMLYSRRLGPPFAMWNSIDSDGIYGWKHGYFLQQEKERFNQSEKHAMMIIVREAPTWLVSSWKMNALGDHLVGTSLWNATSTNKKRFDRVEDYLAFVSVNRLVVPPGPFHRLYFNRPDRDQYRLLGDNVLEVRNKVQKHWLSLMEDPQVKNRIAFVRYEDLRQKTWEKFHDFTQSLNLDCVLNENMFDSVKNHVKYGIEDKKVAPREQHPRLEFCTTVKDQKVYETILQHIDRGFERFVLQYDYPDLLSQYCAEALASVLNIDGPVMSGGGLWPS